MNILNKIYDISPILIQNIMVSLSGYQKNMSRYGKVYHNHKIFLNNFDKLSFEDKLRYQENELINFVKFAYENSLFYKKLYDASGIGNINNISNIEDISRLPIVDKEMLRDNINEVFTIPNKGAVVGNTGGTTGKSLVVLKTKEDMMKRMAILDHFKERVGFINLKMRKATFNGKHIVPPNQKRKIFWRYNIASKQMIYSSFHITEENAKSYVDSLNKFKPQAIDGFFTSMCDIASYIERNNLNIDFQPLAIFPTSETLTKPGRELLERVFKCKVYDQYASSEGAPFVTECENQVLHINLSTGVFEKLSEDSNEILVTSFSTHGTPLIRYRIGDSMIFSDDINTCGCCNVGPIVKEIQGRRLDYLYTANGAKINSANIANLFKYVPNAVIRAQMIQNKLGEILVLLEVDKLRYKVEYDRMIRDEFEHKFGVDTKIIIEHVEEIPREKSGKYRMIKNNINLER